MGREVRLEDFLMIAFLFGIQADFMPAKEQQHHMDRFRNSQTFKETLAEMTRQATLNEISNRIVGMHELVAGMNMNPATEMTGMQEAFKRGYIQQLEDDLALLEKLNRGKLNV